MNVSTVKKRILFVDDEIDFVKMTKRRLEHAGYEVVVAHDGARALSLAMTGPDYDLLLIDLRLPGMDGFEVCQRLREYPKTRRLPIIVMTASAGLWTRMADRCVALQIADRIKKPFVSREMIRRIKDVLKEEDVSHE